MSEMSMKVLAVVIENADKTADEIMTAICRAFPREPYALLEGYIYQLRDRGYLAVLSGDDRIVDISVNPSARVALREANDAPEEKTNQQFSINVNAIHGGQFAMGNKGGSYDMRVSKTIVNEMAIGLRNVLPLAESRMTDALELEQLKRIVNRIAESLERSEKPPQNLIEKLDSFLQKHSWISAPLAAAFINALSKLC